MNTKTITITNTYKDDLCPGLEWPRAAGSFLQSPNNQTTVRTLPTFYISSLSPLSQLRPILPSSSKSHSYHDMIIRTALELESFCKIQIARRDMTAIVIIMDSDQVGMQLFQLLLFVTTILRLEMKSDMYKGNICPLSLPLFSC